MMKTKDLREKSVEQLDADLVSQLKAQFGLRMQHATGQLGNTSELKKVRRNIARIKTVISEKGSK